MAIPTSYPPFVGYYFDFERRVLFTATTASVYSLQTKTTAIFPLVIPQIPDSPDDNALFAKKKIKCLLGYGYVPALFGAKITLVHPKQASLKEPFLCSCENKSIVEQLTHSTETILKKTKDIRFVRVPLHSSSEEESAELEEEELVVAHTPHPALGHLAEFMFYVQQQDFASARRCLEEAVCGFKTMSEYNEVRELQADFYYFTEHYKAAAEIYEDLASKIKEKKTFYLECALRSCPMELKLYKKLKRLYTNDKILHLYLFAMQSFASDKPLLADKYYEKASKLAPDDPIVHFMRISCLKKEEKIEKVLLCRKLAKLFKEKNELRLCMYYLNKNIFRSAEDLHECLVSMRPGSEQVVCAGDERERGYLELIDSFLRQQQYEQAEEAIKQAVNDSIFTFEVLKRLFMVYIHHEKSDLGALAEQIAQFKIE